MFGPGYSEGDLLPFRKLKESGMDVDIGEPEMGSVITEVCDVFYVTTIQANLHFHRLNSILGVSVAPSNASVKLPLPIRCVTEIGFLYQNQKLYLSSAAYQSTLVHHFF
jgi:hypothetical protein